MKPCRKKPPIGLIPERIWKTQRFEDVTEAIQRYLDAGFVVPDEWLDEYSRLKEELRLHTDYQAYGNKLLVIELDSYDSVPTVFYKGKQILGEVKVSFEWETDDAESKKYPHILIKYVDKENEVPVLKTISIQDLFRNDG